MSKSPVNKMKELVSNLPAKDISLAEKFIQARDFESLKELVDSAIIKIKKSQDIQVTEEQYDDINLTPLYELKSEVDSYLLLLGVPEDEVYEERDYGDFSDGLIIGVSDF